MTDLIGELKARRIVKELEPIRRPGAGRPTRPIALDGEPWSVLGLRVDIDAVQVAASTVGGRELWRHEQQLRLRGEGTTAAAALAQLIVEQRERLGSERELVAVEIGVPGYVTADAMTVSWSPELEWTDVTIGAEVASALAAAGVGTAHVGLTNETQLAALHAARIELRLPSDVIAAYIGGRRSVSSGLIVRGEIFRGANGGAGDFGHIKVDPAGPDCWCGRNGCLQSLVGLDHLLVIGDLVASSEASKLVDTAPEQAVEMIVTAAEEGNDRLLQVLAQAGAALGDAIDDVLGVVNPQNVIVGGYLGRLSAYLLPAVERQIAARTKVTAFAGTTVVALSDDAERGLGGAVLAARDACFYDPLALTRPLN